MSSQNSRCECLEITGVPDSISNEDLEKTTLKIFKKLDVTNDPSYIEGYHWLKSNRSKKVIIKFARRKDVSHIRKNKNKLERMNICLIVFNNPVCINDSLCSYYKMLWIKCKKLWSNKYIHAFWVSNDILRLKLNTSGCIQLVTDSQNLDELVTKNELLRDKQ